MAGLSAEVDKVLARRVHDMSILDDDSHETADRDKRLIEAHASFVHNTLTVVGALHKLDIEVNEETLRNMFVMLDGDLDLPWIVIPQSSDKYNASFDSMVEETRSLDHLDRSLGKNGHSLRSIIAFAVFPLIPRFDLKSIDGNKKAIVTSCIFDITADVIETFKPKHLVLLDCETNDMDNEKFKSLRGDWFDNRATVLGSSRKAFRDRKTFYQGRFNGHRLIRSMGVNPDNFLRFNRDTDEDDRKTFGELIDSRFPRLNTRRTVFTNRDNFPPQRRKLRLSDCFDAVVKKSEAELPLKFSRNPTSNDCTSTQHTSSPTSSFFNSQPLKHARPSQGLSVHWILEKMSYECILQVCNDVLEDKTSDASPSLPQYSESQPPDARQEQRTVTPETPVSNRRQPMHSEPSSYITPLFDYNCSFESSHDGTLFRFGARLPPPSPCPETRRRTMRSDQPPSQSQPSVVSISSSPPSSPPDQSLSPSRKKTFNRKREQEGTEEDDVRPATRIKREEGTNETGGEAEIGGSCGGDGG